jgi:PAS domain S-box-containing protein
MSEQQSIFLPSLKGLNPSQIKDLLAFLPVPIIYKESSLLLPNKAILKMLGYEDPETFTLEDWNKTIVANKTFTSVNNSQLILLNKKDLSTCVVEITIYKEELFEIWVLQDVSHYLHLEQQAKDNQAQMANIIASAMDGIITIDNKQKILLFNKAAEEIFGYRKEEVLGKQLDMLIPNRFHSAHKNHINNFEKTGVSNRRMGHLGEVIGLRINGEEFPLEASISQVKIAEQLLHTVILRDITERKRLEIELKKAQEERLARKQELLLDSYKNADKLFSALVEILPNIVLDGKYRLESKIGKGGYGVVYKATHLALNRSVAIKIFRPTTSNESDENLSRFRLEGISTCRVNHPNAVSILDSGVSQEGIVYLVMELLEGHSLATELDLVKTLSVKRCLEILIPTCQVLAEAHRAGIVHRDVKPDNIFLHKAYEGEIVKVVDFGIAKFLDRSSGMIDLQNLTIQGIVLGTPVYMAPERFSNIPYDGRSDIYSLGVTFYQMVSGNPPFDMTGAGGIFNLALLHLSQTPEPLKNLNPKFPLAIDDIVRRLLSKDPKYRPGADELAHELQKILNTLSEEDLNFRFSLKPNFSVSNTDTIVL